MEQHVAKEALLSGAIAIGFRASENLSCRGCEAMYDLLVAYKQSLEADLEEDAIAGKQSPVVSNRQGETIPGEREEGGDLTFVIGLHIRILKCVFIFYIYANLKGNN